MVVTVNNSYRINHMETNFNEYRDALSYDGESFFGGQTCDLATSLVIVEADYQEVICKATPLGC